MGFEICQQQNWRTENTEILTEVKKLKIIKIHANPEKINKFNPALNNQALVW